MNGTLVFILACLIVLAVISLKERPVVKTTRTITNAKVKAVGGRGDTAVDTKREVVAFNTAEFQDTETADTIAKCLASKGVINGATENSNGLVCLLFASGNELSRAVKAVPALDVADRKALLTSYLSFVYPLYPDWSLHAVNQLEEFASTLEFSYAPDKISALPTKKKPFCNANWIEVLPLEKSYQNMDFNTWKAVKYSPRVGTGWFMTVRASLMAYNSMHLLCLCSSQDQYIMSNSCSIFKTFVKSTSMADLRTLCQSPDAKIPWMLTENQPRRYICQIAVQRGYQSIQLGFEWNGTEHEQIFFDLRDPNFSGQNLVRRNPFSVVENKNENYLYLDSFLDDKVTRVDPKFIFDPNPKTLGERYGDFVFKNKCHDKQGTISMDYFLTQCLKILNFGSPAIVLDVERNDIDYSLYPKTTELEKLQSYFTLVYGNPSVWKSKTLIELVDYWQKCEIHYTSCPIFPSTPYPKIGYQLTYINSGKGPIDAYQFRQRGAEAVQYVEVIRTNLRYSWYEETEIFAATFFFPVRGSGLFLPTGRMFVAADKESAAKTLGVTLTYANSYLQDLQIVKALLYKGYDTFMCYYIYGRTEIISLKDPIAAQMSLIKTHPWDPVLAIPNQVVTQEPYFPPVNLVKSCIVAKQFVPPGTCNAPCVPSTYAC
jgi:hypothetical protein